MLSIRTYLLRYVEKFLVLLLLHIVDGYFDRLQVAQNEFELLLLFPFNGVLDGLKLPKDALGPLFYLVCHFAVNGIQI